MKHLKHASILALMLICNVMVAMAQSIPAANHNVGCSSDDGPAVVGYTNVYTIVTAGNRTSSPAGFQPQSWNGIDTPSTDTNDADEHPIYKFTSNIENASAGFGFDAKDESATNTYLHVALYLPSGQGVTNVKVRMAIAPDQQNPNYNNYAVNSASIALKEGWNYINLNVYDSGFHYEYSDAEKFDRSKISQIGLVIAENGRTVYVDDAYFYNYDAPIPSANHNLGCSSDDDSGVTGFNPEGTITVSPAGNRKVTVQNVTLGAWYAMNISNSVDANNEPIYKINTSQNGASGGFTFDQVDLSTVNKYVHAAVYVPEGQGVTTVQIRLSTDGASSEKNNWNDYQVNSRERTLKTGWNYLNLKLDVASEDRNRTQTKSEFAYTGTTSETGSLFFDLTRTHQVGFVFNTSSQPGTVYVSDVYFYSMPYASTNSFYPVINWGTTDGAAECQVSKIAYTYPNPEVDNPIGNGADEKNSTYLGLGRPQAENTTSDNPFYVVAELKNPITVSDVEMVWGNGYPINYEVYALTEADKPETWSPDNIKSKLTNGNRLFSAMNPVVAREPFYNSISDLQNIGNQNGDTKYVVVKMWQPMGTTFGFKLDEIHVGAYYDNYNTVDHIGIGDFAFRTEQYNRQTITPTARNSRNAVLLDHTVTSVNYAIQGEGNDRYVTVGRDVNSDFVWASLPGTYHINVTGSVDNQTISKASTSTLNVTRDWVGDKSNTPSIIQKLTDDAFWASKTELSSQDGEYSIIHIKDGDESTRWSSGQDESTAQNQYIIITLSDDPNKQYKVRDMEFLWERAYPATYAVYGLPTYPVLQRSVTGTDGTTTQAQLTYQDFHDANNNRLLYEATLKPGIDQFPYHDLHTLGTGDVKELNDTRYIVVAFQDAIPQVASNNAKYGVSMFEFYAQATDMSQLNSVQTIKAQDKIMFRDSRDAAVIQGYKSADQTGANLAIDHINGATFSGAKATNNALATTVSEPTNGVYTVSSNIDGAEVEVAQIWDGGNNTYIIQTGKDRRIAGKTYNITANYVLTSTEHNGETAPDDFTLQILKKPMTLAPGSTEENLKFDDGYYVQQMLEEHASKKVLTVDMTDVDFTTGYENADLSKTEIPGPRWINRNSDGSTKEDALNVPIGKNTDGTNLTMSIAKKDREYMNPNVIYFVTAPGVTGENVAVKNASTGEWNIEKLRLFDGYDFDPSVPSGEATIKTHNAIFYTNLPAHKKSTIIVPFDVRRKDLTGVKFYTPSKLTISDDNQGHIKLDETTEVLSGNHIYIAESETEKVVNNGYAVMMVSTSYNKNGESVEVSKVGGSTNLSVDDGTATIEGTYVNRRLTKDDDNFDENSKYYLYSGAWQMFRPADDEWFDFGANPDNMDEKYMFADENDKDYRYRVMPFYASLKLSSTSLHAKAATQISWSVGDDSTTGITDIQLDKNAALDENAPMYDLLGRRVNSSYQGVVIQNGHKFNKK